MKEKLKTIKTIHMALVLGMTVAYFVLGNLHTLDFLKIPKIDASIVIYLAMPIASILLGNFLYKKMLKNADNNLPLEEKMGHYQTASLVRWSLIEGAAFFILFVKMELLIIGLFLIVYMFFLKPSEEAMKRDFQMVGK
jgi:hypothetical protein